jgi:carnitine O-palmitoyltransferase 1
VYLRSRSPILINSNYYGLGYAYHIPSSNQTARAAILMHYYSHFKNMLDNERLTPTLLNKAVPICMRQYERLFCLTREPGRDTDVLVHTDSMHVAVQYKGTWWKMDCYSLDKKPLSAAILKQQLDFIVSAVGRSAPSPTSPEANLPALTAINRTRWAEIREDLFLRDGLNRLSLAELESAMFVVHLDDRSTGKLSNPTDWTTAGKLSLHGNGNTRWCDKSFNLCVYANGDAAVHAEHSWADAPVIAHAWEWVLCHEVLADAYTADGKLKDEVVSAPVERPSRLEWRLGEKASEAVMEAVKFATDLCADLDLRVDCHDFNDGGYGKGFCKKQKCGPDAWIQIALQVAYKRDIGEIPLTYEAAAVRMFNEGRTETIRSVSTESKKFLDVFEDPSVSKEDKIKAFRAACDRHQSTSRDASCGRGVDRHLFALYVAGQAISTDIKFVKEALSIPWKLSTSQIPQRQTTLRAEDPKLLSPSGGFGPVSDEGYGVSYMMADDARTFFHVSSKKSCSKTDSARMMGRIKQALEDIKALFEAKASVEKSSAA